MKEGTTIEELNDSIARYILSINSLVLQGQIAQVSANYVLLKLKVVQRVISPLTKSGKLTDVFKSEGDLLYITSVLELAESLMLFQPEDRQLNSAVLNIFRRLKAITLY